MAKSVSGKINIGVTASTAGLTAGLGVGANKVEAFANKIGGLKTAVLGVGSALGVGLGVGAIKNWLGSTSEAIDETAKLSDRLGLATEDLTAYQHAASLAGVSDAQLASGLGKLQVNLSKAANGIGPAADVLKNALHLDPKQLLEGGTDAALKQIADGIAAVQNPADRARAAMALFGKSGMDMLPMLMGGSDGLSAMAAEAELLGLSFSRVDAAQVEAANDSLTRTKGVFTGLGNQLVIQLAPFVELASNKFREFATSGSTAGEKVMNYLEGVTLNIGYLGNAIQVVEIAVRGMQAGFLSGLSTIATGLAKVINLANNFSQLLPGMSGKFQGLADFANEFASTISIEAGDSMARFATAIEEPWDSTKVKAAFDQIRADARAAGETIAESAQVGIDGAATTFQELNKPEKKPRQVDTKAAALEQGSAAAFSQFLANRGKQNDPMLQINGKIESNTKRMADQLRAAPVVRLAAL